MLLGEIRASTIAFACFSDFKVKRSHLAGEDSLVILMITYLLVVVDGLKNVGHLCPGIITLIL